MSGLCAHYSQVLHISILYLCIYGAGAVASHNTTIAFASALFIYGAVAGTYGERTVYGYFTVSSAIPWPPADVFYGAVAGKYGERTVYGYFTVSSAIPWPPADVFLRRCCCWIRWAYGGRTVSVRWAYGGRTVSVRWAYGGRTVSVRWAYGERTVIVRSFYRFVNDMHGFILLIYGRNSNFHGEFWRNTSINHGRRNGAGYYCYLPLLQYYNVDWEIRLPLFYRHIVFKTI